MTLAQKHLVGALIGLARVTDGNPHLLTPQVREILRSGLALCRREPDACDRQIPAIHAMKSQLAPDCARCSHPCGKNDDFDLDLLAHEPENEREIKQNLLDRAMEKAQEGPCEALSRVLIGIGILNFGESFLQELSKELG